MDLLLLPAPAIEDADYHVFMYYNELIEDAKKDDDYQAYLDDLEAQSNYMEDYHGLH